MVSRTRRVLAEEDIERVAATYHAWRGESTTRPYEDEPGFYASARVDEIEEHGFVLTLGRYVGKRATASPSRRRWSG